MNLNPLVAVHVAAKYICDHQISTDDLMEVERILTEVVAEVHDLPAETRRILAVAVAERVALTRQV